MNIEHPESEMASESKEIFQSIDGQDNTVIEVKDQSDKTARKSGGGIFKRVSFRTAQIAYHLILKRLPGSGFPVLGRLFTRLRRICAKTIMTSCGDRVTIEPRAVFSSECQIGNRSGIGKGCMVGGRTIIGNDVMMGPNCSFWTNNHITERTDIPMNQQGLTKEEPIFIEDDVWLGERVIVLAGVRIGRGSVIGAGAVVSRDIPPYSVAVGNPAKVVKNRLGD